MPIFNTKSFNSERNHLRVNSLFLESTLRKTDHKTWMLKVRIVFGNIKYVKAYDL